LPAPSAAYSAYASPAVPRSFSRAVAQPPLAAVGLTHASSVIPFVRCRDAESATVTRSPVPLNERAPPYLPRAVRVAPVMVPLLPVPELSSTAVPLASPKSRAATRLGTVRSSSSSKAGRRGWRGAVVFRRGRAGRKGVITGLLVGKTRGASRDSAARSSSGA